LRIRVRERVTHARGTGGLIVDLLGWAIVALVISVVAGAFGFGGIASGAATVAKVLFGVFLVVFLGLVLLVALGVSLFA
jgi:uncharacterized membrane protein YtjA (UPF0391 family)